MTRDADARAALAWLKRHATKKDLAAMARYAIPSDHAYGVSMKNIQVLARTLGTDHALAAALWKTGVHEARMLVSFVADPARLTSAQMDRWCRDFDNWAICDTMCFHLFDRTPHAWTKVETWAASPREYIKRTAFALLWSLTMHDKQSGDAPFRRGLKLVERGAQDERHWVMKAVNMALRAVGKRNLALHGAALEAARRLADQPEAAPRWVGKDALRELGSASVLARVRRKR